MQKNSHVEELAAQSALNPERLFGQVAQKLGRAIVAGDYKAGDLLPNEERLSVDLSVSRTAYREAVKILTAKGLVDVKPKSGTRVAPRDNWNLIDPDVLVWQLSMDPSEDVVRQLFELRQIIEPRTAFLAATRRTEAQLAIIDAAMEGMEREAPYSDAAIRADVDFHRSIFAAAGNQALACLAHVVVATIQWSMLVQSKRSADTFAGPAWDHRRVRNAIAERQPALAQAMMDVLVLESLNNTISEFGRSGSRPILL
ncbi:MAG: FadR/GntR family transcriptional regulator [Beijerinckiaceae bacterium]